MIDVTKCIGCRKGMSLFIKEDGSLSHLCIVDGLHKCTNEKEVKPLLNKIEGQEKWKANKSLYEFYKKQSFWWEDIIDLLYVLFKDQEGVTSFMNIKENEKRNHALSNEELESKLLKIAGTYGVEVNKEDYPDLIKWEQEINVNQ